MAITVRELVTRWGFRVNDRELRRANALVRQTKSNINGLNAATTAVGAGIVGAGVGLGAFLNEAGKFEILETTMVGLVGSLEKGSKLLEEITAFTKRTPFRFDDVVLGAQRLLAYNIKTTDVIKSLEALGNIALTVGRDRLPKLILAFGQVRQKGKLEGFEVRQFAESGIGILELIAEMQGKTVEEVDKLKTAGKITFEDVQQAIFFRGKQLNLLNKLSNKFLVLVTRIQDEIKFLAIDIGKELLPAATGYAEAIRSWIVNNKALIKSKILKFMKAFVGFVVAVAKSVGRLIVEIDDLADHFGGLERVGKAVLAVFTAMLAGKILSGVASGVLGITKAIKGLTIAATGVKVAFGLAGAAIFGLFALILELRSFIRGDDTLLERFLVKKGVPKDKIEELRTGLGKIGDALKELFGSVFEVAKEVGGVIGGIFKNLFDIDITSLDGITDSVNSFADALRGLADDIRELNEAFKEDAFFDFLKRNTKLLGKDLGEFFLPTFFKDEEELKKDREATRKIAKAALGTLNDAADKIADFILLKDLRNIVKGFGGAKDFLLSPNPILTSFGLSGLRNRDINVSPLFDIKLDFSSLTPEQVVPEFERKMQDVIGRRFGVELGRTARQALNDLDGTESTSPQPSGGQ